MPRPRRPDRPPAPRARALAGVLAAALAGAAPARAELGVAPAGGGALEIAVEPPTLVLGKDGWADLRIAAPAEVEELAVSASAGRVETVRRLPGGGFAARFRPPPDRHPQVALVAAVGRAPRGLLDGWVAIPLAGQGDARVKAPPGSEITLRIGDRTFGPKRAGADGVAVIPVVVPPGVREAHHGFRPIDLHVPETPLLHAVADRLTVHADRAEQVRVLAYVVAPHGAARRGDVPVFEPTRGGVTVAAREAGAFEAVWSVPAGASQEERLAIRLPGAPLSRAVLRLEVIPGPPANVAVAFDREALEAGADGVAVTARVLDAAGNAVPAALELGADAGTLSPLAAIGPGAIATTLRVPPHFAGRRAVTVVARVPAAGLSVARVLPLRAGPPAAARFTAGAGVVIADGKAEARLRVAVHDRFENPVEVAPAVVAQRGRVLGVAADGGGAFVVRYRPPAVPARVDERLVAEVGPVRAHADVLLVPPRRGWALSASAGGAVDVRGRFAAGSAGLAVERAAPAPLPLDGVAFAWRLEAAALGFERRGPSRSVVLPPPQPRTVSERAATDVRAGALLAGAALRRDLRRGPVLRASLAAGALLSRAHPEGAAAETGLSPAARLTLGAELLLPRVEPFLELSALAAGPGPGGAFAALGLSAGARFDLGGP